MITQLVLVFCTLGMKLYRTPVFVVTGYVQYLVKIQLIYY